VIDGKIDASKPVRIEEFRRYLGEAVDLVQFGKERVVVERYGKRAVVLISVEEYARYCEWETEWRPAVVTTAPVRIDAFRRVLGEAAANVQFGHERLVIERRGKKTGVLISFGDYARFCEDPTRVATT
jgi:prevent-host-death family protein